MTDYSPIEVLLQTDGYKLDHRRQYALSGEVTRVYSNYTNRKSRLDGVDHVVHFGLQAYLTEMHEGFGRFFAADEREVADLYMRRLEKILGFEVASAIGPHHIVALHRLGYVPLEIHALPEGTRVPIGVPVLTVTNTHPDFAWLTNYIESSLSASYWATSTAATIAAEYRRILDAAAAETGADPAAVEGQCHDFSYRGMSSNATAAGVGAAHLLSFTGTDSLVAMDWIERYYGGDYTLSTIPATEHSVMSTGIEVFGEGRDRRVGELELFSKLLDLYPSGPVAVVSDTFDLWNVCNGILPMLKDRILARDGTLVIRPDSGDPVTILCGTGKRGAAPEDLGVVQLLWNVFGGTINDKGFKVLDPHIGVVYGDSITLERAREITGRLKAMGFVSTTVTLGVGSYSYQYVTRDTFGSAVKATQVQVDGVAIDIRKDPITDDGTKRSATGRLAVLRALTEPHELYLVQQASTWAERESLLALAYLDGEFMARQSFAQVREVLNSPPSTAHNLSEVKGLRVPQQVLQGQPEGTPVNSE